ncbi:HtaA domain-containing protein [Streptomyces ferrugineus]|uniref:HtaA domain-containing protein n=1 Tax=Streptomyces ferrugineus TaxID=1413221 RepID=A0A7M2SDJ2_9ACTN|nr:HtaA domain-containing protein [Streptomyces ferrugineus]QOV34386.1 HtaA domain-containing protein [Streptomyces ferrugineus]
MTKRPGAAAVTGGALLALLCPAAGSAVAQDTQAFEHAVSGGSASWSTTDAEPADLGMSVDVTEPAVRGTADRPSFPAMSGSIDLETGSVDVELGGAARIVPADASDQPLTLAGLRLRLNGDDGGTLHARTAVGSRARELTLADVTASDDGPVVRAGGVTWTGLRAALTDDGARLLSQWSGEPFEQGDDLGLLDVAVATRNSASPRPTDSAEPPPAEPSAETPPPDTEAPEPAKKPAAAVAVDELAAGGEQTVTGTGFEPGEVVLVAIDHDTRYQTTADAAGRVARTFPVYDSAAEGAHTVELYSVSGGRDAVAEFDVRAASASRQRT